MDKLYFKITQVEFEVKLIKNNFTFQVVVFHQYIIITYKNINDNPKFNRLIVCLDGEEIGVEES
jgi:hypothetical protein